MVMNKSPASLPRVAHSPRPKLRIIVTDEQGELLDSCEIDVEIVRSTALGARSEAFAARAILESTDVAKDMIDVELGAYLRRSKGRK